MEARERDLGKMFLKRGCSDGSWKGALGRRKRIQGIKQDPGQPGAYMGYHHTLSKGTRQVLSYIGEGTFMCISSLNPTLP